MRGQQESHKGLHGRLRQKSKPHVDRPKKEMVRDQNATSPVLQENDDGDGNDEDFPINTWSRRIRGTKKKSKCPDGGGSYGESTKGELKVSDESSESPDASTENLSASEKEGDSSLQRDTRFKRKARDKIVEGEEVAMGKSLVRQVECRTKEICEMRERSHEDEKPLPERPKRLIEGIRAYFERLEVLLNGICRRTWGRNCYGWNFCI